MVSTIHSVSQPAVHQPRQSPPELSPSFQTTPKVSSAKPLHDNQDDCPSPLFTDISHSDSASMSSSSHDAFYLEKYNNESIPDPSVKQPFDNSKSARKSKPALNIMTSLPRFQAQASDNNLTLERVPAKKVGAITRPKSVVSAKAEHFHMSDSEQTDGSRAYSKLKALASSGRERKWRRRNLHQQREESEHLPCENDPNHSVHEVEDEESASNAVMIGIRVPEDEAALHQAGQHSAITLETPNTPVIVVTPAELNQVVQSQSAPCPSDMQTGPGKVPSVPAIPRLLEKQITVRSNDTQSGDRSGGDEEARHNSQGWWNLALSPMLSRAGTTKAAHTHAIPEIPAISEAMSCNRARSNTSECQISPQTPRRLGLAGIRASIWSHWTTEHKQPPERRTSTNTTFPRTSIFEQGKDRLLQETEEKAKVIPQRGACGLADEYYHACAIEQLSGQPFFECQNHSCVEKWPRFRSIYDDKALSPTRGLHTADTGHIQSLVDVSTEKIGITMVHRQGVLSGDQRSASAHSEDLDLEISPNVREAEPASVLQAKSVDNRALSVVPAGLVPIAFEDASAVEPILYHTTDSPHASVAQAMDKSPLRPQSSRYPNIAAIIPPSSATDHMVQVASPGPLSPGIQRIMAFDGDVPMTEMKSIASRTPAPTAVHNYYHYPFREVPKHSVVATTEVPFVYTKPSSSGEFDKAAKTEKPNILLRLTRMLKRKRIAHQTKIVERKQDKKTNRKHRCIVALICVGLTAVVIASILLATLLTPRGLRTPTQTQWLNLTGFPPIPTGISTIIRPDAVVQSSQCVQPQTAWSCAVPPEQQSEITPNNANQPNFRFEIKFRNGTVPSNMTMPTTSTRTLGKRVTNPFTDSSFDANPPPPSEADQLFLGNTTDNNTSPFEGEETPFYISFIAAFPIDPFDISTSLATVVNNSSQLNVRQSPSLGDLVPAPDVDDSGLAAPGNLLPNSPFPTNQPIHLYNRGTPTEHFGFYIYYDRSIFLSTDVISNINSSTNGSSSSSSSSTDPIFVSPGSSNAGAGNPSDLSGGSPRIGTARSRCTWAQTRFLVQIYTSVDFAGALLGPVPQIGNSGGAKDDEMKTTTAEDNSATNYAPPGSFPYPTSITLDRHGGNVVRKSVYCYGIDEKGRVRQGDDGAGGGGRFVLEQRGVGGTLVNEAPTVVAGGGGSGDELEGSGSTSDGIDGGSGGCACRWQNWR